MQIAGSQQSEYARYQHSGKLGNALILVPLCSLFLAPLAGWIVGAFSYMIPYMKLRILADCLVGLGLGGGVGWLAYRGRCRSPFFAAVCGLAAATLGLYVLMIAYVATIMNLTGTPVTFWTLLFDPPAAWRMLEAINSSGFFTKNGRPISGNRLWADWGFEGIAFFLSAAIPPYFFIRNKVFCEACDCWLKMAEGQIRVAVPADPAEMEALKAGDLDMLANQKRLAPPPFIRLDHIICPHCGNSGAYRYKLVASGEKETESDLSPLMQLTPASAQKLGALLVEEEERRKKFNADVQKANPPAGEEK